VVEMPIATSPDRPSASTWRENSESNPKSLPQAVITEESVVNAIAAMAARSVL